MTRPSSTAELEANSSSMGTCAPQLRAMAGATGALTAQATTTSRPAAVGCSRLSDRLSAASGAGLRHERTQHRVDSGLIPGPLGLEPVENVRVDPERNRLFRHRLDHLRRGPEVIRQASQLSGRRALNRRVRDPPQPGEAGAAAARTGLGLLARRLDAHCDYSLWPK